MTNTLSLRPALSPDGKQVGYFYLDAQQWGLAVISLEDGQLVKKFAITPAVGSRYVRWTPDGHALAYIITHAGVSNIWLQTLDGGLPRQLTDFKSEYLFYFDWSRDGKHLACARGIVANDVVMISDHQ